MIIDFRVRLPFTEQFPDADPDDLSFVPYYMSHYLELFSIAVEQKESVSTETLLESMEQNGIERAVLQAEWEFGDYTALNKGVQKLVERYPEKFIGFCTVHPEESRDMVREVAEWVSQGIPYTGK